MTAVHAATADVVTVAAVWALALLVLVLFVALLMLFFGGVRLSRRVEVVEAQLCEYVPVSCRVCGCTDEMACLSGCWWAEPDLCSSCADDAASTFEARR